MASSCSTLEINSELTGTALATGLPQSPARWCKTSLRFVLRLPGNGRHDQRAAKVWCGKCQASLTEEARTPEGQQEFLWRELFSDTAQWWDNRESKKSPRHPDFKHKQSKDVLWVNNRLKPAWVDSQLAEWDSRMMRPPGSVPTSVGASGRLAVDEGEMEVAKWWQLCEEGQVTEAVHAMDLLVERGCQIPQNVFYRVLKKCIVQKELVLGRRIDVLSTKSGYEGNAFLATHLIGLYASHGRLEEAMTVFSKVCTPDAYNWSSIIFAYARNGDPKKAIGLYRQQTRESGVKPDNHVFLAVLKACASARDLATGKDVHAHILATGGKPDMFIQNSLVHMYAKCGSLENARSVFDGLSQKNVVTWTAMIAGYAQQGMGQEALNLYSAMQQEGITPPNSVTYVCLLQACASVGLAALHHGKQLHLQVEGRGLQDDVVVGGSLVNMYAKCGSVENAQRVFDRLSRKNVVTWTAMIAGYASQGMGQKALDLYCSMQQEGISPPDFVAFVCLLQACAGVGAVALQQGKQLHAQIEEQGLQDNVVIGGGLVNMYAKCGSVKTAQLLFDRLPQKNVVTWTAMIAGYVQQGLDQEALSLYSSMQQEGITPPDSVTYTCLLQACTATAALPLGKQLHAQIEQQGLQADVLVGACLVNLYAKCGSMVDSQQVFDSLPEKDIGAWNALIAGYTHQGDSEAVLDLFSKLRVEHIQPNSITFLSLLTVCSHVGLVDRSREYFQVMTADYGITPNIEHYTCMMDLLGRAGHLEQALSMVRSMPLQPDGAVWRTLLGACRKWGNVEVGRQAFELAVSVNKQDASAFVLMSNIYEDAQMWEEAKEVQARRANCGALKQPGQSWWTDMGGVVHAFAVGDRKHPESEGIYARLEQLVPK